VNDFKVNDFKVDEAKRIESGLQPFYMCLGFSFVTLRQ